jgi:Protein of unknown function (DUF1403)
MRSPSPSPGRSSARRDGSTWRSGRSAVRAILFVPGAWRRSRPTCSRRLIRETRRTSPLRWGRRLRAVRPAPVVAAAAAAAVVALKRDAEPLALFCADAALAKSLGWPTPLPLLASELFQRRATGEGRRPRPGESGWAKLVALATARAALSALDLAQDLSRRAARLAEAAPKLRAKGKTRALEALLADDAVAAAAPIAGLSDRARRRLFERLVALGAARELTGRPSFRLYGLFCNGPRTVNPFVASSLRRVTLLSVVGARPPPDGIR